MGQSRLTNPSVKFGSELLVPRSEKLVRVVNEESGSSAVPGAANRVGTSSERADISAVLSRFDRLDGLPCVGRDSSMEKSSYNVREQGSKFN